MHIFMELEIEQTLAGEEGGQGVGFNHAHVWYHPSSEDGQRELLASSHHLHVGQ
jgi:hypothetical protein